MGHSGKRPKGLNRELGETLQCLFLCKTPCRCFSVEVSPLPSLTASMVPRRQIIQNSNFLMGCLMSVFLSFQKELAICKYLVLLYEMDLFQCWPLIKFTLHKNPISMMYTTLPQPPRKDTAGRSGKADRTSTPCNPGFIATEDETVHLVAFGSCEECQCPTSIPDVCVCPGR